MTDESIDWVDGKGWYELTDREQALLSKVHDEAYARGFRDGERFGAEEALRASTTLTTAFENRPTQRALRVLERLLGIVSTAENERGSVYWHTEEVEAP